MSDRLRTIRRHAGMWLVVATLATAAAMPAAAQRNNRPPRPEVTLPEGPVRQVILGSCTACHGIDEYGYYAMDRDAWRALIERMKVTPSGVVNGATISDRDREILLDWLVAEFGPDSTPFPREYVIPKLDAADSLSRDEAEALLTRACESCHSPVDRVVRAPFDDDEWRATLVEKIARGVPLSIGEVEPLIAWLTGSSGTRATD